MMELMTIEDVNKIEKEFFEDGFVMTQVQIQQRLLVLKTAGMEFEQVMRIVTRETMMIKDVRILVEGLEKDGNALILSHLLLQVNVDFDVGMVSK